MGAEPAWVDTGEDGPMAQDWNAPVAKRQAGFISRLSSFTQIKPVLC